MANIEWNTTVMPKSEIICVCSECQAELARVPYNGYHDHNHKKANLKKQIMNCRNCKAVFFEKANKPKWERQGNGDYIAACQNGDFLVWKFGSAYRWRYRTYGKLYADFGGQSYTRQKAQEACEKCKEWKVAL